MTQLFSTKLVELSSAGDLAQFREGLARRGGLPVSLEYLRAARVFGVNDKADRLVGGFVLSSPPRRAFELLPAPAVDALNEWLRSRSLSLADVFEATALWRAEDRKGVVFRTRIWCWVVQQCIRSGSRYVLVYSRRPGLQRIYELGAPVTVWCGPPDADGRTERLYLHNAANLTLALVRYLPDRLALAAGRARARLSRAPIGGGLPERGRLAGSRVPPESDSSDVGPAPP